MVSNSNGKIIDTFSFVIKCIFKQLINREDLVSTSYTSELGVYTTIGIITGVNRFENNISEALTRNVAYLARVEVPSVLLDDAKGYQTVPWHPLATQLNLLPLNN
ncbi:hypothetical protein BH23THE1_BH23THE1_15440 [soil metagenome]